MSADPSLVAMLEKAGLGHTISGFEQGGVLTPSQLVALTMQDYQSVGVVVMSDRRKLFELVQSSKRGNTIPPVTTTQQQKPANSNAVQPQKEEQKVVAEEPPIIDVNLDGSYPLLMRLGLIPPKIFLSCLASMFGVGAVYNFYPKFNSTFLLQPAFTPKMWTRLVAAGVALLGLHVSVSSRLLFKRKNNNIMSKNQKELVTDEGYFRWTRNPMYLGLLLVMGSVFAQLPNRVNAAFPLVFFSCVQFGYIPWEETCMRKEFPEKYDKYFARTARWFLFF